MPIWTPQTISHPYKVAPNAKPTEEDFCKSGMAPYTNYEAETEEIPPHVALNDFHVYKTLKAKAASHQKWPADFSTKGIRAYGQNRGKAAKHRKFGKENWRYHTISGHHLLGDEGRTAGIPKKAGLVDEDVVCVRQHDLDPSDEAVTGRERQESAARRSGKVYKLRKDHGTSSVHDGSLPKNHSPIEPFLMRNGR